MPRRTTYAPATPSPARSAMDRVARGVRAVLFALLGVLAVLAISEVPAVRSWTGGLGRGRPRVGLLAGHWQNDSGAVCPDGLQEAEVNLAVARRAAQLLREQGILVEVLPEYAAALDGYRADAFLAIHADSCLEGYSGFKVARLASKVDGAASDRLVGSVEEAYATATGLALSVDTITDDMREYHALRQIAPETPGAIIECGFLGGDRYLLTTEQDRVAVGIANGVEAFLRAEAEGDATATP